MRRRQGSPSAVRRPHLAGVAGDHRRPTARSRHRHPQPATPGERPARRPRGRGRVGEQPLSVERTGGPLAPRSARVLDAGLSSVHALGAKVAPGVVGEPRRPRAARPPAETPGNDRLVAVGDRQQAGPERREHRAVGEHDHARAGPEPPRRPAIGVRRRPVGEQPPVLRGRLGQLRVARCPLAQPSRRARRGIAARASQQRSGDVDAQRAGERARRRARPTSGSSRRRPPRNSPGSRSPAATRRRSGSARRPPSPIAGRAGRGAGALEGRRAARRTAAGRVIDPPPRPNELQRYRRVRDLQWPPGRSRHSTGTCAVGQQRHVGRGPADIERAHAPRAELRTPHNRPRGTPAPRTRVVGVDRAGLGHATGRAVGVDDLQRAGQPALSHARSSAG